jgi:hypothetical protein
MESWYGLQAISRLATECGQTIATETDTAGKIESVESGWMMVVVVYPIPIIHSPFISSTCLCLFAQWRVQLSQSSAQPQPVFLLPWAMADFLDTNTIDLIATLNPT